MEGLPRAGSAYKAAGNLDLGSDLQPGSDAPGLELVHGDSQDEAKTVGA